MTRKKNKTMEKMSLPIRFGFVTAAVLVAYFLILALFGKHTNIFYSMANALITGLGIHETIKYTRIRQDKGFRYGNGFSAGIVCGFVATILFTLFFAFYATEVDTAFLQHLSRAWSSDYENFEGIVFFTVAIMGFATTVVLTLAIMQLYKSVNDPKK